MIRRLEGNTINFAIKLRSLIFTEDSRVVQPFTPITGDVFQVSFTDAKKYTFTDITLDTTTDTTTAILRFTDNGTMIPGVYQMEVKVTRADGTKLRSLRARVLEILRHSFPVPDGCPVTGDGAELSANLFLFGKGDKGDEGKSAYEVAVDNGYVGTEAQWLESLKADATAEINALAATVPNSVTQGSESVSFNRTSGSSTTSLFTLPKAGASGAGVMSAEQAEQLANKADAATVPNQVFYGADRVTFRRDDGGTPTELFSVSAASPTLGAGVMSVAQAEKLASAADVSVVPYDVVSDTTQVRIVNSDNLMLFPLPTASTATAGVMTASQVSLLNSKAQVYDFGNDLYEGDIATADYEVLAAKLAKVGSGEYIGTFIGGIAMYYTLSNSTIQIGFLTNDGSDNSIIVFSVSRVETSAGYHTITSSTKVLADAANVVNNAIADESVVDLRHGTTDLFPLPTATTTTAGIMTAAMRRKLAALDENGIPVYDLSSMLTGTSMTAAQYTTFSTIFNKLRNGQAIAVYYSAVLSQVTIGSGAAMYFVSIDNANSRLKYITITVADTEGSGGTHAITKTETSIPNNADVASKADSPTLSVQSTAPATLAPTINTYTRIDSSVGTMSVTLPAISAGTFSALSIAFTSSATPAVTFTTADGKSIVYASDFAIDAETTYEVSALFNGVNWVLAYATFD